ncbi:MAG: hypothetical protein AABX96_04120 [Nanoarchaeota archaeon]
MNFTEVTSFNIEKECRELMFLDNQNHPYKILTRTTLLVPIENKLAIEDAFFVAYLDSGINGYIPIKTSENHKYIGTHRGLRKVS